MQMNAVSIKAEISEELRRQERNANRKKSKPAIIPLVVPTRAPISPPQNPANLLVGKLLTRLDNILDRNGKPKDGEIDELRRQINSLPVRVATIHTELEEKLEKIISG